MSKRTGWVLARWLLIVGLCGGLVAGVYRFAPRAISERIPAVQFYLGANHRIRQVTIAIHGSWWYTIEGNRSFQGTIGIYGPGEGNPYDYEHRTVTTTLYPFGGGPLLWQGGSAGQPWAFAYGSLFASRDFRQISIMAPNGLIIAGSASTRKGGLRIANRLIPASLGLKVLK